MNLLSTNDFKFLKEAMILREEKFLIRTFRDLTVSAQTCRVDPPWTVDMIVQIRMEKGHISWVQNFKSVDAAKEYMDRWEERFHWIS